MSAKIKPAPYSFTLKSVFLVIGATLIVLFAIYNLLYPGVTTQDEFLTAGDGVVAMNYIKQLLQGNVASPIAFVNEYQAKTIGVLINVYPPLVTILYAIAFSIFGISLLSAKIVHLLFAIAFFCLFYAMMRKEHGEQPAAWMTLLLLFNFSFFKFFSILQREIMYLFFIFSAMFLLQEYVLTKKRWCLNLFLLCLTFGSMTKDFFLFVFPSLLLIVLMHVRFSFKRTLKLCRETLRWDSVLLSLLFIICTLGFYGLKFATSGKEKDLLFGGFTPVQGAIDYFLFLFNEVPVLLIACMVVLLFYMWQLAHKRQMWSAKYVLLLAVIFAVLISVSHKEIRYIFVFYPIATVLLVAWIFALPARFRQITLGVFLAATIIFSALAIQTHTLSQSSVFFTADQHAGKELAQRDGNILFLTHGFRFDFSFYSRQYRYNGSIINSFFEKINADRLSWSRFRVFYLQEPSCVQTFTTSCWERFIAHANITTIVVDRQMFSGDPVARVHFDPDAAEYAHYLAATQTPIITTPFTFVYAVE